MVKTRDPVALLYNDDSVLENSHAACFFLILTNHATTNILSELPDDDWLFLRQMILLGIKATDMAKHGELLEKFRTSPVPKKGEHDMKYVQTILQLLAKCCDLAHLVRPWDTAKEWEDRVQEEFFQQGDTEKKLGMEPMGLMDREKCNIVGSQLWFYANMGKPLYEALILHIPEAEFLLKQMMEINFVNWEKMKDA